MIRAVEPTDTDCLVALTEQTGVFKPHELVALREVLDEYHAGNAGLGHRAFAWVAEGRIQGYVYYAPTPMTDRSWHLYWIAVDRTEQGRGLGGRLLAFVEADVKGHDGRLLIIETSSTPLYQLTRRFYRKHGYTPVATVPDFYADGDDLVVFTKRL